MALSKLPMMLSLSQWPSDLAHQALRDNRSFSKTTPFFSVIRVWLQTFVWQLMPSSTSRVYTLIFVCAFSNLQPMRSSTANESASIRLRSEFIRIALFFVTMSPLCSLGLLFGRPLETLRRACSRMLAVFLFGSTENDCPSASYNQSTDLSRRSPGTAFTTSNAHSCHPIICQKTTSPAPRGPTAKQSREMMASSPSRPVCSTP